MIDEKNIEEAAKEYAAKRPPIINCGARIGFEAGINWFLDNLWHDASEDPKEDKIALVKARTSYMNGEEYIEYIVAEYTHDEFPHWRSISIPDGCEGYDEISYAYIDDLLKGGK